MHPFLYRKEQKMDEHTTLVVYFDEDVDGIPPLAFMEAVLQFFGGKRDAAWITMAAQEIGVIDWYIVVHLQERTMPSMAMDLITEDQMRFNQKLLAHNMWVDFFHDGRLPYWRLMIFEDRGPRQVSGFAYREAAYQNAQNLLGGL